MRVLLTLAFQVGRFVAALRMMGERAPVDVQIGHLDFGVVRLDDRYIVRVQEVEK
jgi:hypothetical protein